MGILDKIFGAINGAPNGMPLQMQSDIQREVNSIYDVYISCNKNYLDTFCNAYLSTLDKLMQRLGGFNGDEYAPLVYVMFSNDLRNFKDLVIVDLYISVVPPSHSNFEKTCAACNEYVSKRLIQIGLPSQYVIGNNTQLTKNFIKEAREKFNVNF